MFWRSIRAHFSFVCILLATPPAHAQFEAAHEFTLETKSFCASQLLHWPFPALPESF